MQVPVVKVEIVEERENFLKIKLVGQKTTLAVLLSKRLLRREDVNFSSWSIDHPEHDYAYLLITASNPREKLKQTIDELLEECEKLEQSFETACKTAGNPAK
ncbi:MAG: hypothetical protein GXO42_01760 [bacterium]|nr:hypothetical protein [bacterium]